MKVFLLLLLISLCHGQIPVKGAKNLHNGLTEKIGNFSVELLYRTTELQPKQTNLILSPITVWTILAVIMEGAEDETLKELGMALRISPKNKLKTRSEFQNIAQWLQVTSSAVELQKFNALFVDNNKLPLPDFVDNAKSYDAKMISVDFSDSLNTAIRINTDISTFTHNRIPKIVDPDDLRDTQMLLSSALYFKGQWTVPFNTSQTTKQPFYDSMGKKLGEVNMMYNRYTYPFASIKALQARVIEIPYGKENRLSMLIMLPNNGVSLKDMFLNFNTVSLDVVFNELKASVEEYGEEEVDCFIPRFKIESSLTLTDPLKTMNIYDLFDASRASLPYISRIPLYVAKVLHKAEIEVTEEGTTASAVTLSEFSNRIGVIRFEANRPFCFLIIEKVTNSIAFGGFYQVPTLY